MAVQIVLGPRGCGKSAFILEKLCSLYASEPSKVLVVSQGATPDEFRERFPLQEVLRNICIVDETQLTSALSSGDFRAFFLLIFFHLMKMPVDT